MDKAQQVRETLLDLADLIDAHVDSTIVLQLAAPGTLDRDALTRLLKTQGVEIEDVRRADKLKF